MAESTLKKWAAVAGIAFVVLQLVSQGLIQYGGSEPAFNAPSEEIVAFFTSKNSQFVAIGEYLSVLSLFLFLWFLGALWSVLRDAEGEPAWLSLVAVASGIVMVASILGGGWPLAFFRMEEGLEPQMARMLFDEGNYGFATIWVAIASFLAATAAVSLRSGVLPRWLAWSGAVIAIGLLAARAVWAAPTGTVFIPYALFWLWMIATSVVLLRRPVV